MSCGCGGKLPVSVQLRMEAVRLSQAPDSRLNAEQVLAFITEGIDVAELDKRHEQPSRNDILNMPLRKFAPLTAVSRKAIESLHRGIDTVGTLAQLSWAECERITNEATANQIVAALSTQGLVMGMTPSELRDWLKAE